MRWSRVVRSTVESNGTVKFYRFQFLANILCIILWMIISMSKVVYLDAQRNKAKCFYSMKGVLSWLNIL